MEPSNLAPHAQKLLDLLLRYVVSGGAAILAFGAVQTPSFGFLRVAGGAGGTEVSSWLMLLYVVVVGPAIYAVHRSVLHPVVLACVLFFLKRRHAPALSVRELDLRVAKMLATGRAETNQWIPTNDAWSAQIHFLYCASWGIGFAFGLHFLIDPAQLNKHVGVGIAVGLALLASAVAGDWRLNTWQLERLLADEGLTTRSKGRA